MCQLNFREKIHFNTTKNPFFDILKSTYQKHIFLVRISKIKSIFAQTKSLNIRKNAIFELKKSLDFRTQMILFPRFHVIV